MKRFLAAILIFAMPLFGVLPASETFSGSDGQSLTAYSSNWTNANNSFVIASSAVRASATSVECAARWNADTFSADQFSQITVSAVQDDAFIGPAVRISSSSASYYGLYADTNQTFLFEVISGSWSQIGPSGSGVTAGDVLRLEISGNTLTPYRNGSVEASIGSRTDSSLTGGSAGICGWASNTGTRGDGWSGGNITETTPVTRYISPSGSDSNSGLTEGSPLRTFSTALPLLSAGDTLILLDGSYTAATTGLINITAAHRDGTSASPIVVKAANERGALIASTGATDALRVNSASFWTFEGLRLESADFNDPTVNGGGIWAISSNNLVFRRLLIRFSNRYVQCFMVYLQECTSSLMEDVEVYDIHGHGIYVENSGGTGSNVLRRCYVNRRGYPNLGGGSSFVAPVGIALRPSNSTIIENCVVETGFGGIDVGAVTTCVGNQILGSIAYNNTIAIQIKTQGNTLTTMVRDMVIRDVLAIANTTVNSIGVMVRGTKNTIIDRVTAIGTANSAGGVYVDFETGAAGDGTRTVACTNSISQNASAGYGFFVENHTTATLDEVYSDNSGTDFQGWSATNDTAADPGTGTCRAFIPLGCAVAGAGVGGVDIGANVKWRYVNGTMTTVPLWDPRTGKFPCGAMVTGVNDAGTTSCTNLNERIFVNSGSCNLPNGYARIHGGFF